MLFYVFLNFLSIISLKIFIPIFLHSVDPQEFTKEIISENCGIGLREAQMMPRVLLRCLNGALRRRKRVMMMTVDIGRMMTSLAKGMMLTEEHLRGNERNIMSRFFSLILNDYNLYSIVTLTRFFRVND